MSKDRAKSFKGACLLPSQLDWGVKECSRTLRAPKSVSHCCLKCHHYSLGANHCPCPAPYLPREPGFLVQTLSSVVCVLSAVFQLQLWKHLYVDSCRIFRIFSASLLTLLHVPQISLIKCKSVHGILQLETLQNLRALGIEPRLLSVPCMARLDPPP